VLNKFWMFLILWGAKHLFEYIDIYSPDKENIVGITMTNNEIYLNKVTEIE